MKKLIILISVLIFFSNQILADQKLKDLTPEENYPTIDQFPEAFKHYNVKYTELFNQINKLTKGQRVNLSNKFSQKFKEEIAAEFINIKLFHSKLNHNDDFHKFYRQHGKLGHFAEVLNYLEYPYNYFLPHCDGIVLVEIINDTILPYASLMPLSLKCNRRVLYAQVIDDLFDTVEEDTIIVSHDYNIYDNLYFKYNSPLLFFGICSGNDRLFGDKRIHTYHMIGKARSREDMVDYPQRYPPRVEHAFVVNDTIRDPYHVYDFDGYSYEDFKIQFLTDVKNAGIKK